MLGGGSGGSPPPPPHPYYHERQRLELCALHALNNVLQRPCFTQQAADDICKRLAPSALLNPHRGLLGLGNYDVNVIMAALQSVGLAALWWDKRRPLSLLALPHIHGFILNVPTPLTLGSVSIPWWRRPHWLAIKQLGGVYYNLDSKLPQPRPIGDQEQLRSYLAGFLSHGDSQLFLVVSKDVEEDGTWLGPQ